MESLKYLLERGFSMKNKSILVNDFGFKYIFGADTKESNDALKSMLEVFLERKIKYVHVKNPELTKNIENMKDSRLDILVEFDDSVIVDIEMQMSVQGDNHMIRFQYYVCRIHGQQELKGKPYEAIKATYLLSFLNENVYADDEFYHQFQMRTKKGMAYIEKNDPVQIFTVELKKLNQNKPISEMNEKEMLVYYFLHCKDEEFDSKIKEMVEQVEVIQMVDKRVNEIDDNYWNKILDDFEQIHENEKEVRLEQAKAEAKAEGLAEGIAEGLAEGIAEGRQETLMQNVQKLSSVLSSQQIADTLDLTLEEVESYLK